MYYGFDMGGTKIELGVFNENLELVWQKRVPTPHDSYEMLLETFLSLTNQADQELGCKGKVGVGVPGIVNTKAGTVFTTNVPTAQYKPLVTDLQTVLSRPVKVENDANCFALSEAWDPEFRQYNSVLGLILGTGVGGGFTLNGRVVSGKNGIAGEIGHINMTLEGAKILENRVPTIRCGCGKIGCFETYLSGPGFERIYQCFNNQSLRAIDIVARYYDNDEKAKAHVERYMSLLAHYLGNVLSVLDPDLLVIGGGLSQFEELYRLLPEYLPQHLYGIAQLPAIEKARYGDAGGARGAACLNILD